MTVDDVVEKEAESSWRCIWKAAKDLDRGMDDSTALHFYFTLWMTTVGLSFFRSEKARNYNLKTGTEHASRAERLGNDIGTGIGMCSAVVLESVLLITTFPYCLGALLITNTAGYFYYQKKIKERQLQLPEK